MSKCLTAKLVLTKAFLTACRKETVVPLPLAIIIRKPNLAFLYRLLALADRGAQLQLTALPQAVNASAPACCPMQIRETCVICEDGRGFGPRDTLPRGSRGHRPDESALPELRASGKVTARSRTGDLSKFCRSSSICTNFISFFRGPCLGGLSAFL